MRFAIRFRDWDSTFEGETLSFVIGRPKAGSETPDIDLSPDRTVSRPHARFFFQDDTWHLEDLGSTHGTQLNGREIRGEGAQPLLPGDTFQCGETQLRPQLERQRATPLPQLAPAQSVIAQALAPAPSVHLPGLMNAVPEFEAPAPAVSLPKRPDSELLEPLTPLDLTPALPLDASEYDLFEPIEKPAAVKYADPSIEFALPAWGGTDFPPLEGASLQIGRLYGLLMECGSVLELDDVLRELLARLVEVMPAAQRGALLLHSRETDTLLLAAFYGSNRPAVSETLARRAMQEREGFLWRGLAEPDSIPSGGSLARFAITSALIAPLVWRGETLGVLCIDNPEGATFSLDDLRVLMFVAHHVALAIANRRLSEDLRRESNLKANLLRQFSPQYREQLTNPAGLQLSGERGEVTILVSDIRGFEALTRHMEPIAVIEMLNDYFSRLSPIIWNHGGSIDKYIGDAILAVFGSPKKDPDQHENALKAALEMQAEMARSNAARAKKGKVTCEIGIGVHCGLALHGFMGVLDQLSLTVIGDAVNRASRYCDGARGGEIIMSPQVYQWVWKDVQATSTSLTTKHGDSLAAFRLLCFGDSRD